MTKREEYRGWLFWVGLFLGLLMILVIGIVMDVAYHNFLDWIRGVG